MAANVAADDERASRQATIAAKAMLSTTQRASKSMRR